MKPRAFTLIELLVVVAIIVTLIAILLPSMGRAKEVSIRAVCGSHLKQLANLTVTYAAANKMALPSGSRDNGGQHTPWISSLLHDYIIEAGGIVGEAERGPLGYYDKGGTKILDCPNFVDGFQDTEVRYVGGVRIGYVVGYQYLGAQDRVEKINRENPIPGSTNGQWRTFMRLGDDGTGEVWADYNNWTPGGWVFVAHTRLGALDAGGSTLPYRNYSLAGERPENAGAEGGSVAHIDGSVRWKNLDQMNEHHSFEANFNYPAYW